MSNEKSKIQNIKSIETLDNFIFLAHLGPKSTRILFEYTSKKGSLFTQ